MYQPPLSPEDTKRIAQKVAQDLGYTGQKAEEYVAGVVRRLEEPRTELLKRVTIYPEPTRYTHYRKAEPPSPTPTPSISESAAKGGPFSVPATSPTPLARSEARLTELQAAYEEAPPKSKLEAYEKYERFYKTEYRPTYERHRTVSKAKRERDWLKSAAELRTTGLTKTEVSGIKVNLDYIQKVSKSQAEAQRRVDDYMAQWSPVVAKRSAKATVPSAIVQPDKSISHSLMESAYQFPTQYRDLPGPMEDIIGVVAQGGAAIVGIADEIGYTIASIFKPEVRAKYTPPTSPSTIFGTPEYREKYLAGAVIGAPFELAAWFAGGKGAGLALGKVVKPLAKVPGVGRAAGWAARHPKAIKYPGAAVVVGVESVRGVELYQKGGWPAVLSTIPRDIAGIVGFGAGMQRGISGKAAKGEIMVRKGERVFTKLDVIKEPGTDLMEAQVHFKIVPKGTPRAMPVKDYLASFKRVTGQSISPSRLGGYEVTVGKRGGEGYIWLLKRTGVPVHDKTLSWAGAQTRGGIFGPTLKTAKGKFQLGEHVAKWAGEAKGDKMISVFATEKGIAPLPSVSGTRTYAEKMLRFPKGEAFAVHVSPGPGGGESLIGKAMQKTGTFGGGQQLLLKTSPELASAWGAAGDVFFPAEEAVSWIWAGAGAGVMGLTGLAAGMRVEPKAAPRVGVGSAVKIGVRQIPLNVMMTGVGTGLVSGTAGAQAQVSAQSVAQVQKAGQVQMTQLMQPLPVVSSTPLLAAFKLPPRIRRAGARRRGVPRAWRHGLRLHPLGNILQAYKEVISRGAFPVQKRARKRKRRRR